jgi:hypothetical protein
MSGNVKFNGWINDDGSENYKCRAWVNFNGQDPVTIRASGGVSSITDNGTGDYSVNFTTAMPDANYAWTHGVSDGATTGLGRTVNPQNTATKSTTQFQVEVQHTNSSMNDPDYLCLAFFR